MSTINTHKFSYLTQGNRENPALLFLHGFLGNCQDFLPIIDRLSEQFYCISVDLPGHGKSPIFPDEKSYTITAIASALITFLDTLFLSQCYLVGYSMGGRLSLYLTCHFPHRFMRVILESSSPGLKTETERLQRLQADRNLAEKLTKIPLTNFLKEWYQQPLFHSLQNHPKFPQLIHQRSQQNSQELAKALRGMSTGNQPSLWEKLPQNQVPLLLLVGEQDIKFTKINQEIHQICSHSSLEIIPKVGHNIHWENPQIYLDHVKKFLQ